MRTGSEAGQELDGGGAAARDFHRETVGPVTNSRRVELRRGKKNHVRRTGEVKEVLKAGRRARHVRKGNCESLTGDRAAGDADAAGNVIKLLPVLQIAGDPGVGATFVDSLKDVGGGAGGVDANA